MFVCKRVSRSGSFQPISNRFGTLKIGDVILACQRESLSGICRANQQSFGTSTMDDVTIPRIMTEKPRCRKAHFYSQTVVKPRRAE